jgi:hypothetical protein
MTLSNVRLSAGRAVGTDAYRRRAERRGLQGHAHSGRSVAVNAKDAAWVDAMCVKQPLATFEQKLTLSGRKVPKRVYMLAAGWEPSPFQQFGARYKDDRDWQFVSFACGHDVMVDRPQELAAALIAAA